MIAVSDLELVRSIVLEKLKGYAVRVYLFGSRARGDAQRTSDIDVAVQPLEPLPGWVLAELRAALEESDCLYRVDVVNLYEAAPALRERVLAEGILWSS